MITATAGSIYGAMKFNFVLSNITWTANATATPTLLYKPVTEKHPYGYAQVESLFLLVKYSVLLALTCNLMIENIKLLLHGGHDVDAGSIAIFVAGSC